MWSVNKGATDVIAGLVAQPEYFRCAKLTVAGSTVIDCGVEMPGTWEAGRIFVLAGLGGLANVSYGSMKLKEGFVPTISTEVDQPVLSAVLSHAGAWALGDGPLAPIGSGPIRAKAKVDRWARLIPYFDNFPQAVLLLQTPTLPSEPVVAKAAQAAGVAPKDLVVLVARTGSLVGSIQVAGRTVEQVLVKMAYHGFDLSRVVWARGTAPIAPPTDDEELAMGRVNDSLLYGADDQVWVEADDRELAELVPKLVFSSHAGNLYGSCFVDIFKGYGSNWFNVPAQIDSPAKVTVLNLKSGRAFAAGRNDPTVLARSFGIKS